MEHPKYQEQFWCFKFTTKFSFNQNLETYKIRKNIKSFASIYKNGKNNYNIWCYWNRETKISLT